MYSFTRFLKRNKDKEKPNQEDVDKEKKKRERKHVSWGAKERRLVAVLLVGSVFLSLLLAFSARDWKAPNLGRIDFKTFFGQSTFVLEGNDKENSKGNITTIEEFKDKTSPLSGVYGFWVYDFGSGSQYGLYHDEAFEAASLIKLPLFLTLYQEAEDGSINLDDVYILKDSDKVGGSGSLQYKAAGTKITYREMAELMGRESDNTAFSIVRKTLGDRKIQEMIFSLDLIGTSLAENQTTPKEAGKFFRHLYNADVITKEASQEILGYMTDTIYEDHLPKGVPDGVRVSHKYGREIHVVNDAGIVYDDAPYILVIMTKGVVESEADQIFPELSRLVYENQVK